MTQEVSMMVAAVILSLVIGIVLGMLGGGGAILTLPMLVYALGVAPKTAIAMSLFVVGSTSVVGAAINARSRNVRWSVGSAFGATSMVGAFAGARLASFIPATVLLVLFASMMLVTAIAMMRPRAEAPGVHKLALGRALVLGAGVGLLSGLVGAGGGFLIVPALTLFGGLNLRHAIGTSLFVIALQSFAGFAGHIGHVTLDWPLVAAVTSASVAGTIVGALGAKKVSTTRLRSGFAWLVIAMGLFVIGKQLSLVVTGIVAAVTVVALLLVTRSRAGLTPKETCTTSPHSPH